MQELCRKLKPKNIEDLSALNALYRPGPIDGGMVDDFIQRHHGKKSVRYIVPEMKEILENTHGVIVYQEQAMLLSQRLAGYTMAEADSLRKAMGKKNREEMAQQEQKFIMGAVARGIKQDKAQQIFSLMRQFADYGFPKAHSVAYAYLAFQTAHLKAHYPEHFYAAVLSNEIEDTAKVFRYTKEMRGQGIELLPPDVNESEVGFTPLKGAIRYGLAAIKGIGFASVNAIIKARANGPFQSMVDFAERVEEGGINKRVLEGLVCSGAFDSLADSNAINLWRAALSAQIDSALAGAARSKKARALGQDDLFGAAPPPTSATATVRADVNPWTLGEMLAAEKKALGFYITAHPLDDYSEVISKLGASSSIEVPAIETGGRARVAGLVKDLQLRTTKKGDRFALFQLEDYAGTVKCVAWPEPFRKHSNFLRAEAVVLVTGRVENTDEGQTTVIIDKVSELDQAIQQKATEVTIQLPAAIELPAICESVKAILENARGDCEVYVEVICADKRVRMRAHPSLKVQGSVQLESALRNLGCEVRWDGYTSPMRVAVAGAK
jgi:DNA polymerase III subunit alpha